MTGGVSRGIPLFSLFSSLHIEKILWLPWKHNLLFLVVEEEGVNMWYRHTHMAFYHKFPYHALVMRNQNYLGKICFFLSHWECQNILQFQPHGWIIIKRKSTKLQVTLTGKKKSWLSGTTIKSSTALEVEYDYCQLFVDESKLQIIVFNCNSTSMQLLLIC